MPATNFCRRQEDVRVLVLHERRAAAGCVMETVLGDDVDDGTPEAPENAFDACVRGKPITRAVYTSTVCGIAKDRVVREPNLRRFAVGLRG